MTLIPMYICNIATRVYFPVSFERPVSEAPGPPVPHGVDYRGGHHTAEHQAVDQHGHPSLVSPLISAMSICTVQISPPTRHLNVILPMWQFPTIHISPSCLL